MADISKIICLYYYREQIIAALNCTIVRLLLVIARYQNYMHMHEKRRGEVHEGERGSSWLDQRKQRYTCPDLHQYPGVVVIR